MRTEPSVLTRPSRVELRAGLECLVLLDLHGQDGDPEEEISERSIRDRYPIGILAPRTVLDRLLALNHERYAIEVKAGLHDKGTKETQKNMAGRKQQTKGRDSSGTAWAALRKGDY